MQGFHASGLMHPAPPERGHHVAPGVSEAGGGEVRTLSAFSSSFFLPLRPATHFTMLHFQCRILPGTSGLTTGKPLVHHPRVRSSSAD
jgi:hypothetical protein